MGKIDNRIEITVVLNTFLKMIVFFKDDVV